MSPSLSALWADNLGQPLKVATEKVFVDNLQETLLRASAMY